MTTTRTRGLRELQTIADGGGHFPASAAEIAAAKAELVERVTVFPTWAVRRTAIGRAAKEAVVTGAEQGWTLNKVMNETRKQTAGYMVEGRTGYGDGPLTHEVERQVKLRVTIGRCNGHSATRVAFWFPKNEGRLGDKHCPACGSGLDQTTLALNATFTRHREEIR